MVVKWLEDRGQGTGIRDQGIDAQSVPACVKHDPVQATTGSMKLRDQNPE
jgi:hypothetical protein